ncbi:hypothetical protein N0V82_008893 [Gnomoniopsis sp. IMI 355080]|nr:hypothetical protein N0V82_008893 [Gnomoniopsis sp. IMI 355080]
MMLDDETSKKTAEGFQAEGLLQAIGVVGWRAEVIPLPPGCSPYIMKGHVPAPAQPPRLCRDIVTDSPRCKGFGKGEQEEDVPPIDDCYVYHQKTAPRNEESDKTGG